MGMGGKDGGGCFGLSRSERGVGFNGEVGVGAGQSPSWVQLPVNVIIEGETCGRARPQQIEVQRLGQPIL